MIIFGVKFFNASSMILHWFSKEKFNSFSRFFLISSYNVSWQVILLSWVDKTIVSLDILTGILKINLPDALIWGLIVGQLWPGALSKLQITELSGTLIITFSTINLVTIKLASAKRSLWFFDIFPQFFEIWVKRLLSLSLNRQPRPLSQNTGLWLDNRSGPVSKTSLTAHVMGQPCRYAQWSRTGTAYASSQIQNSFAFILLISTYFWESSSKGDWFHDQYTLNYN